MQGWIGRLGGSARTLVVSRASLFLGGLLAVCFAGTIAYAAVVITSPDDNGVINACVDKGGKSAGKIRIVSAGSTCKNSEFPLKWKDLSNFNNAEGSSCTFTDRGNQPRPGTIALTYDAATGRASLTCQVADPQCGDFIVNGSEQCDDGNVASGDGCSTSCEVEGSSCGDGSIDPGEECDDNGTSNDDGCSASCTVEANWSCSGEPSVCAADEGSCTASNSGASQNCEVSNEFGTCSGQEICQPPAGWSSCDAQTPAAEVCDGQDNDCDGTADEGLGGEACGDAGTTACVGGVTVCQEP